MNASFRARVFLAPCEWLWVCELQGGLTFLVSRQGALLLLLASSLLTDKCFNSKSVPILANDYSGHTRQLTVDAFGCCHLYLWYSLAVPPTHLSQDHGREVEDRDCARSRRGHGHGYTSRSPRRLFSCFLYTHCSTRAYTLHD